MRNVFGFVVAITAAAGRAQAYGSEYGAPLPDAPHPPATTGDLVFVGVLAVALAGLFMVGWWRSRSEAARAPKA